MYSKYPEVSQKSDFKMCKNIEDLSSQLRNDKNQTHYTSKLLECQVIYYTRKRAHLRIYLFLIFQFYGRNFCCESYITDFKVLFLSTLMTKRADPKAYISTPSFFNILSRTVPPKLVLYKLIINQFHNERNV